MELLTALLRLLMIWGFGTYVIIVGSCLQPTDGGYNPGPRPPISETMVGDAFERFPDCAPMSEAKENYLYTRVLVKTLDGTVRKMRFSRAWDLAEADKAGYWESKIWVLGVCGKGVDMTDFLSSDKVIS